MDKLQSFSDWYSAAGSTPKVEHLISRLKRMKIQGNVNQIKRRTYPYAFVKQYNAPDGFSFPNEFDLAVNSLLFAESIRGEFRTIVLLYWTSEDRVRSMEASVIEKLGLSSPAALGGIVELKTPQKPKWRETPARWGQWVVTAAAIFGAFSVLQDHFTELLGRPNVVIFAGDKAPVDIHAGQPIDLPVEFRNQGTLGHVEIRVHSVQLKPQSPKDPGIPIRSPISEVSEILAGQNSEVQLSAFTAPVQYSSVQRYTLEVEASAKEGYLWPSKQINSVPFEIAVWPDRTDDFQVKKIAPAVVRIEIALGSGIALDKGLRGQLTFTSADAPIPDGIVLTGGASLVDAPIVVSNDFISSAKVEFQTEPLQAFRTITVSITVAFQSSLTDAQWSKLQSSIKVVVA